MKRQHTLTFAPLDFTWIDLVNPSEKDLKALAKQFNLDKSSVLDCLDPEHLPKFEKLSNYYFLILRHSDEECLGTADTVQELTRKVAIFVGSNFLLTVHRKDARFFENLRKRWQETPKDSTTGESLPWPADVSFQILHEVIIAALESYEDPLAVANDELEQLEMGIFEAAGASPFEMERGYFLKRKASVYKRIIRATQDVTQKFQINIPNFQVQQIKESLDKMYFYADELNENVASLMNLYLSLSAHKTNVASHRTNEVIRILTVASLFFLPLNFIAGVYGMNFENMPELKWANGYYIVITVMAIVVVGLYGWFRHRGWLQPAPPETEHSRTLGEVPQYPPAPTNKD